MKVQFKKLSENAVIPKYAKPGDAGMDLVATSITTTDDYIQYGTDLAVAIPEGYVGLIFPRSSNSKYDLLLCNSVGVIDSGYRGEIGIRFKVIPNNEALNEIFSEVYDWISLHPISPKIYEVGDKVAQLVIMPYPQIEPVEVNELNETERGEGGFGSTGQ